MAAVLIAVNVISVVLHDRVDLTEEKLYTLSKGTRGILKQMDTPVTIRYYYTQDAAQMPVFLRNYAQHVEDLLNEYRLASNGKIVVRKYNPSPDSDAEDSANLDGVYGQALGSGDKVYLGLAISCLDQTVALPFLSPERQELLEYDVTRAVYRILHPDKPVLGVMSSLPVMGQRQPNPMMMQMQRNQNEPPWLLVTELKRDFEVREIATDVDSIDEKINVLLLVHAKDLSEKTLYAIDQFVLRGGKLVAFMDPMSMVDSRSNPMSQMQYMPPGGSNLGKLLDTWGVKFEPEKVVADMVYVTRVQGRDGEPDAMPTVLSLTKDAVKADDPVTSQLNSLLFAFSGTFSGDAAAGLTRDILVSTSEDSQLVEKFMAQMPGDGIMKSFKSEERKQALAIRLKGKFKTAFPSGKPATDSKDASKEEDEKKDETKKEGEDAAKTGGGSLQESATDGVVVLVGDSDMLYDHFCIRKQNFLGQEFVTPLNDNLNFVQNLIEQLSGDSNLIGIRCRGAIARPFLVVRRMQADAEQKYQDRIRSLEDELSEAQRKINEIQREKSKDQKFILSKEQQDTIAKFRQKEAETRKELKVVRKNLRREVDSLETRLEWANLALMPALVMLGGVVLSVYKRRRMVQR
jgi:ABC-type uncharacterized transport system involved in gliding motility auxiliary subunit